MVSVGRHENITLMTYSEVEKVSGVVGDFHVQVNKKARYVNETLCTGCGVCVEKCPWKKIPDEFEFGLGNRSAIHFHYDQAVPKVPVIDPEHCAYFKTGKCRACEKFCQRGAIDFSQQDEIINLDVGVIILATGFKDFDPAVSPKYGYGSYPDVITGREFERLINTAGPTTGAVLLADGTTPKKIGVIHCVGSRGDQHEYCSRACCMYSLKLAHLAREMAGVEVVEFYRDMRTFGKSYEDFYQKVRDDQVEFIRFREEISVSKNGTGLAVETVDLMTGTKLEVPVDMVILSAGMEPQENQQDIASTFGISLSPDGFFLEKHPKLAPVETATAGVFLAGTCQGPKDIPDTVAQASAAAASALALMDAGSVRLEPFTAFVLEEKCSGCLICMDTCPFQAIEPICVNGRIISHVNEIICKGCGTCVAACPSGAAVQNGFTNIQIFAELDGILSHELIVE